MKARFTVLMLVVALMLVVVAVVPAFAQDVTDIPVWIAFTDDSRLGWSQARADEFNEMFPQYNVVITGYPNYEELFTQTALASEQGSLPAIVQYFEVATQNARDSGYFRAIGEALGDRTEVNGVAFDLEDFNPAVTAYYTLDGEFTSMPWNTSSAIMFSNMGYLSAAGIDTPPATWAEVDAACEAIMALDTAPAYCWTWPNHGWFFEQWLAQQDALFANNGNGRDAAATEVDVQQRRWPGDPEFPRGSVQQGLPVLQRRAGWQLVGDGRPGFRRAGSGDGRLQQLGHDLLHPTGRGQRLRRGGIVHALQRRDWLDGQPDRRREPVADRWLAPEVEDGALTFLAFFTNTENAATWHQTTGYIPLRNSSVEMLQGEGWFDENPNSTVAFDQLAQSAVTPATSGALLGSFPAIRNLVTQAIDTVLLSDAAPADVLAETAAAANVMIEEYNLLNAE